MCKNTKGIFELLRNRARYFVPYSVLEQVDYLYTTWMVNANMLFFGLRWDGGVREERYLLLLGIYLLHKALCCFRFFWVCLGGFPPHFCHGHL